MQNFCLKRLMAKILITGGAGFIGSHLAHSLAKNNKVMIVDNLESKGSIPFIDKKNLFIKGNILEKILNKIKNGNQRQYIILLLNQVVKEHMIIQKKISILMVLEHALLLIWLKKLIVSILFMPVVLLFMVLLKN